MATRMQMMDATQAKESPIEAPLWPGLKTLEENILKAQRMVAEGRRATEELMSTTASKVQQHPLAAIALTTGAAALLGCLTGYAVGRQAASARRRYPLIRLFY